MEKVEGRGAVFDVEEPAFLFLCHVKPDLKSKQLLGAGSEKWRRNQYNGFPSPGLAAQSSPVWYDLTLTPMVSLDSKQSM